MNLRFIDEQRSVYDDYREAVEGSHATYEPSVRFGEGSNMQVADRKVCGVWFGGSSYRTPEASDLEVFDSIEEAQDIFAARRAGFDPISGLATPVVDGESRMWLFFEEPEVVSQALADGDAYPDMIVRFDDDVEDVAVEEAL